MRHESLTDEIQETASLYALGALSQHEARAFESHLDEGCDVCAAELSRFEDAVGGLDIGVAEMEPPSYVRDLLVARLERETPRAAPVAPSPPPHKELETGRRRSVVRDYLPWLIAASLAVCAVILFFRERQATLEIANQQQVVREARSQAERLQVALDQERLKSRELEQIRSALSSPGARVILLASQEPAPSASATIIWDTQRNQWVVSATLPQPPSGKVFQLWFVTPTAKVSAGLIEPDPAGHGFAVVPVPPDIGRIAAAAITLEPSGGSSQPTTPIYALGKVG